MTGGSRLVATSTGVYRTVPGAVVRTQALAVAPLLDEWTAAAPVVIAAESLTPNVHAHCSAGHLVLTGRPDRAVPGLATAPAHLDARLRRPGRAGEVVRVTIPAGSALPFHAPAVLLATGVTAVAGRVREAAFPHSAVAGAAVQVGGGVSAGSLLGLRCPLAAPHDAGTTVTARTLAVVGSTSLAAAAEAGAGRLHLASTAAVAPGRVLALDPDLRAEHVVVDAVEAGDVVVLRVPLRRTAPAGTAVRVHDLGAAGVGSALARASLAGDGVLVTAAVVGAAVVEVVDGAATEYRATGLVTAADGAWRLDGVRGIPDLTLTFSAAGFTTVGPTAHPLSPTRDPNVVDVELPV